MANMDRAGSLRDVLEFVENPEPRFPCALLVDTSLSMGKNGRYNANWTVRFKRSAIS